MAQLKLRNPFDETPATVAQRPVAPKTGPRPVDDNAGERPTGAGPEEVPGPQPTIRLSVDLERPLHRRLRRWALERDQTASDLIRELLT
jgi:hypothetical protein